MRFPTRPRVFITGAGSGRGRGFALALARDGARLLLGDISLAGAEETGRLACAAGAEAVALHCDVSRLACIEAAAAQLTQRWGGIDLLVNNAGIAAAGKVGEQSLSDWEAVVAVNLWGPIFACHVLVPIMKRQRRGFVLNVSAGASFLSLPEMAAYNVTKAALVSLSETMHAELATDGIHVSARCPTFVKTNLLETGRFSDPGQARVAKALLRRSRATVEEVVQAGLRGVLRNQLIVIPQRDGAVLWRLKRHAPGLYFRAIRNLSSRRLAGLFHEQRGASPDARAAQAVPQVDEHAARDGQSSDHGAIPHARQ